MTSRKHRSFRLSPEPTEPYLVGKRVVPRLRYILYGVNLFQFVLMIGGFALFLMLIYYIPAIHPRNRPFGIIGAVGYLPLLLLVKFGSFYVGRRLAVMCGLMTRAEASVYQRKMSRWPASWLEEVPGEEEVHPLDDRRESV